MVVDDLGDAGEVGLRVGLDHQEHFAQLGTGAGKFDLRRLLHCPFDADGAVARADHNGVTIAQLQRGHGAFGQKVVEIDLVDQLVATQHFDIDKAATVRIDTTGAVQVVENGIGRKAVIKAGIFNIPGNEHLHRLTGFQIGVGMHVVLEHLLDVAQHKAVQLTILDSRHMYRAHFGDKDIPLRVD